MATSRPEAAHPDQFPGRSAALAAVRRHGGNLATGRRAGHNIAQVQDPAVLDGEVAAAAAPFHSRRIPRFATANTTGRFPPGVSASVIRQTLGQARKPQPEISEGRLARAQRVPTYEQLVRKHRKAKAEAM